MVIYAVLYHTLCVAYIFMWACVTRVLFVICWTGGIDWTELYQCLCRHTALIFPIWLLLSAVGVNIWIMSTHRVKAKTHSRIHLSDSIGWCTMMTFNSCTLTNMIASLLFKYVQFVYGRVCRTSSIEWDESKIDYGIIRARQIVHVFCAHIGHMTIFENGTAVVSAVHDDDIQDDRVCVCALISSGFWRLL